MLCALIAPRRQPFFRPYEIFEWKKNRCRILLDDQHARAYVFEPKTKPQRQQYWFRIYATFNRLIHFIFSNNFRGKPAHLTANDDNDESYSATGTDDEPSVIVQLSNRVLDGTRCRSGSLDMCIQGKCQVNTNKIRIDLWIWNWSLWYQNFIKTKFCEIILMKTNIICMENEIIDIQVQSK